MPWVFVIRFGGVYEKSKKFNCRLLGDFSCDEFFTSWYDEGTDTFVDYDIPASGIMPFEQISTSDLSLAWGLSRYSTSGNLLVTYSYDWLNLPVERFSDSIGISWDSDIFRMLDNTFYKVDKYNRKNMDIRGLPIRVLCGMRISRIHGPHRRMPCMGMVNFSWNT